MSEGEKDQGIKIVDKRRFADDGAERQESRSESSKGQTASAAAAKPETASGKAAGPGSVAKDSSEGRAVGGAVSGEEAGKRQAGAPAVNFNNFVLGLGTQALVLMGEIPNPETGLVNANFSAAKQTIDILGMLEEKTKGNLTEDEGTLLTEVLSSLRLAFVNRLNSK